MVNGCLTYNAYSIQFLGKKRLKKKDLAFKHNN